MPKRSGHVLALYRGDVFAMEKGHHGQSKANATFSYSSEQGMQQKATAPTPPSAEVAPLSFAEKARWFALGLVGGIFAMIIKLALPCKMPFEQRKQSEWAVWAGFAVNTFILVVLINTGCIDALVANAMGAGVAPAAPVSPAFG